MPRTYTIGLTRRHQGTPELDPLRHAKPSAGADYALCGARVHRPLAVIPDAARALELGLVVAAGPRHPVPLPAPWDRDHPRACPRCRRRSADIATTDARIATARDLSRRVADLRRTR